MGIDYRSLNRSRHSLLVRYSVLLYARTPHRYCMTTYFFPCSQPRAAPIKDLFFYARIETFIDQLFSLQVYSGDDNRGILNLLVIDLMLLACLQ